MRTGEKPQPAVIPLPRLRFEIARTAPEISDSRVYNAYKVQHLKGGSTLMLFSGSVTIQQLHRADYWMLRILQKACTEPS